MQNFTFSQLALVFIVYSATGWVCETVWCSVGARKWVNRGFLSGPWCPVYGFGGLLILFFAAPFNNNPALVLLISVLATTALEYFTGWLLETLFQTRWWDYSGRRFNLKGRVCLRNSLLFGLLALALVYLLHPAVWQAINALRPQTQRVLACVLCAALGLDAVHALAAATVLRQRLEGMKAVIAELKGYQNSYAWFDKADPAGSIARLRAICEGGGADGRAAEVLARIDRLGERRGGGLRMLGAFPTMRPKGFAQELQVLRRDRDARRAPDKAHRRERRAQRGEELRQKAREAYRGVTLTSLVWMFLIGCVAGYLLEIAYDLLTAGVIEGGQGMLYGPFNQAYGFGAVVLVLLLAPLARRGNGLLFCAGAIWGGLYQAGYSLVQQALFGISSWHYDGRPLALPGGRTSLVHMALWGALGVLCLRLVYPKICRFAGGMAKRPRRFFTAVVSIGLLLNLLLSALAVGRWMERRRGEAPGGRLEALLDEKYPDDVLEEIYPGMRPAEKTK